MSITVWGVVGRIGEISEHRNRHGQITDAHLFRSLDLELPAVTRIDLDHNPEHTIGTVTYAELTPEERIQVVGVIDGLDLDQIDKPVYMSGEWELRGDVCKQVYCAREAQLLSVGLTLKTATHGNQPIRWLPGDIRHSPDRYSNWPSSWRDQHPLLARAHDRHGDSGPRYRACARVADLAAEAAAEEFHRAREQQFHQARSRVDDRLTPPQARANWKPGDLEWSCHEGRVLSVR